MTVMTEEEADALDELLTKTTPAVNPAIRGVTVKEKAAKKQGGCPICAKYRDPVTGQPRFNAETIAAFEEGDAMLRGEIPAKWYNSLEEMDKMLEL